MNDLPRQLPQSAEYATPQLTLSVPCPSPSLPPSTNPSVQPEPNLALLLKVSGAERAWKGGGRRTEKVRAEEEGGEEKAAWLGCRVAEEEQPGLATLVVRGGELVQPGLALWLAVAAAVVLLVPAGQVTVAGKRRLGPVLVAAMAENAYP